MRTRKFLYLSALLLWLVATSCGYGSMTTTGTSPWNVSMSSGVQSHYYSYSGR